MNALKKKTSLTQNNDTGLDLKDVQGFCEHVLAKPHAQLCDFLSETGPDIFMPTAIRVGFAEISSLAEVLPQQGLFFAYGAEDKALSVMSYVSVELAHRVTQMALMTDSMSQPAGATSEVTRLDLVLFSPVADQIGQLFTEAFVQPLGGASQGSVTFERLKADLSADMVGLSPKALGDSPPLIAIDFSIALESEAKGVDDEKPQPKKSAKAKPKPKATAKEKVKGVKAGSELKYTLYMRQDIYAALRLTQSLMETDMEGEVSEHSANPWSAHLQNCVNDSRVDLRIVAETCQMTIAECTRLSLDQIIPLPGISLQSVDVEVDFYEEDSVASDLQVLKTVKITQGSLGVYKTSRAVMLSESLDPAFVQDLQS